MEKASVAFCPGHISGYFFPVKTGNPETTGSRGAGIVIEEGVTSSVRKSAVTRVTILRTDFSGRTIEQFNGSHPVEYAIGKLGVTADITTRCRLPISAGFGLSAAALLSSIRATVHFFSLDLTPGECSMLAHEAEVLYKTGLGDVAACGGGGIDCRKTAGIYADVIRLPPPPGPLYAVTFGPLPSPGLLGSAIAMEKVKSAFPGHCPQDIEDFFRLSRSFAEKSGLITPEVRVALDECDARGVLASMTMLGNGIFAYGNNARHVLRSLGEVFELSIATAGVRQAGYDFV